MKTLTLCALLLGAGSLAGFLSFNGRLVAAAAGEDPSSASLLSGFNPPGGTSNFASDHRVPFWEVQYEGWTLGSVTEELNLLRKSIDDFTEPYYEGQFEKGLYQVIGKYVPGIPYVVHQPPNELYMLRMLPGGDVGKVTLPETMFREAYELAPQIKWLMRKQQQLEVLEGKQAG